MLKLPAFVVAVNLTEDKQKANHIKLAYPVKKSGNHECAREKLV